MVLYFEIVHSIILVIDVRIELDSLDVFFDDINHKNLEVLLLLDTLWYTDGKVIGSDEGIKMGSIGGNVISTILGNVYGITLGLDFGTELENFIWFIWWF